MSSSEHVSVPVDYYRLLQVPRVSRPDAIRKAYEQHMRQSPATAYSADTLFARAVLLKAAAESLTDPDLRRSYDAKLAAGHSALRVSQQDLPGALVVLQEIGEYQLVLELGARWLELNGNQPDAGDVAAAVALAYCDRAGERLAAPDSGGAVLPACDDLDAALARLRRYGMAKQLQSQIVSALRDLAPDYACELAALPLGPDNTARRAKGVTLMRGVLRAAAAATDAARGTRTDAEAVAMLQSDALGEADDEARSAWGHARRMMQRGRDVLTCSEQVSLLPDALRGSGPVPHPDVVYDGALALIVDGFRNGWPHSIHKADSLLAYMEQGAAAAFAVAREQQDLAAAAALRRVHYGGAAAASSPGVYHYGEESAGSVSGQGQEPRHGGAGVALERAVCAVLLGDYEAAVELLGLQGGGAEAHAEDGDAARAAQEAAQLREFVLANSPSGVQDLRPGLCALTIRWLEGVALANFRDTTGQPVRPLQQSWFANPRVAAYLQVRRMFDAEQVLAAAHFLCNLLPTTAKLVSELAAKLAVVMAAMVARAQRIAFILVSAAAVAAKKGASGAGKSAPAPIPAVKSRPPGGKQGPGPHGPAAGAQLMPAHGPAAEAGLGPLPVDRDVEFPTGPSRPPGSASSSPFGHPYGKPVSAIPRGSIGAAAPAAAGLAATAAVATLPRAVPQQLTDQGEEHQGSAPDLRRRFAASAATDAALIDGSARLAAERGGQADAVDLDDHNDLHDEVEDDVLQDELVPPASGQSEAELRAHLAGLEAAMWDSEEPGAGEAKQKQLLIWIAGAVAIAAAFFAIFLRRPSVPSPSSSMVLMAPAAVSLASTSSSISAFRLRPVLRVSTA
ncbi:hypothetical protein GPECTOR_19g346 [Gonium pectorale]|uniref:J domain-containing protein n=1 Tax=Gonium pectorale TaxID=33097 RepID=A0A150GJN7_GONPE|nr:hypothetical protein GPECTOR_19g346 [Gonium pectorale]|eukprot:KXZ49895.1 hypothetical protein GPECTOR_19g346 [Gonium pectorale]